MNNTKINAFGGAPNIQVVVNLMDLKELFLGWQKELMSEEQAKSTEESYLTADEVAVKYHTSKVTLWRWAKDNILTPTKCGRKVLYAQSELDRVFKK